MPYKSDSTDLPKHIQKLSGSLKAKWIAIFNRIALKDGDKMALVVANGWLSKQVANRKKEMAARAKDFKSIKFEMDTSGEFIKRDADGNDYISFSLADTLNDVQYNYSPELLQQWADDINAGNMIVGDFSHDEFDKITMQYADAETIKSKLKGKKGIAKVVKAIYEKGKLWVKAFIDKRYRKVIEKAKISLEAFVNQGELKTEGELLGFSFLVNGEEAGNPTLSVS